MAQPIFFLSFANQVQSPLPFLEMESDQIYRVLTPKANQERIQIHRENFATIDKIAEHLMQFKNRVTVFHYAGHADSQQLFFNEESANANGIALQLAEQELLKLVFLNGCSTQKQVKYLLELGIPAVIATSTSINDSAASDFAQNFYAAIASNHSIKKAFEMAGAIFTTKSNQPKPKIYRDTILRPKMPTEELPWGLYVKDQSVLDELLIPANNKLQEKNILRNVEIDIDGNIDIGDKHINGNESITNKNIIEGSKINSEGNFRLGDG